MKDKNIPLLWFAQMISTAGDAIYHLALIWLILDLTGSSIVTGLVAMSTYLPAMLFSLYAGVLSDRMQRMALMVFSNLAQALTVILIPIMLYKGHEATLMIGILAFIRAAFGTLFPPAFNAFIPTIVERESLVRVNSIMATSQQFAWLIGPAAAGLLLGFISLKMLFVLDAISFILATLLLLLVRHQQKPVRKTDHSAMNDLVEGSRYLAGHPFIGFFIGLTVLNNLFIMGPAIVGTPILVKEVLGGTASDFAFVEACLALGMLIGSLSVIYLRKVIKPGLLLLIGMILDGVTYSIFYVADSVSFVMVFITLHAIGIPMITVSRTAIIQRHTPNWIHGRLFSMVHIAVVGMTALSSALVGLIADSVDIRVIFFWIGIGAALCGAVGLLNKEIRTAD